MNIGDILTLSDKNKYVIASKTNYDYKVFLCLIDISNNKNVKFGYLDNDEVIVIKNDKMNSILLLKLIRNSVITIKDNI